jgi:cobalt-zinc-cadmium resistance protein CzcA
MKISAYETDRERKLREGAVNLPRTEFLFSQGNINSQEQDNSFGVTQRLAFPTVYGSQRRLAQARVKVSQLQEAVRRYELVRSVRTAYVRVVYFKAKDLLLRQQDSIYSELETASALRYRSGETNRLESVTSLAQALEVRNLIRQNQADLNMASQQLQTLLNTTDPITTVEGSLTKQILDFPSSGGAVLGQNPTLLYLRHQIKINEQQTELEKQKKLPEFLLGYTNQSFRGVQIATGNQEIFTLGDRFSVFHLGMSVPLLPGGYRAQAQAAKIAEQVAHTRLEYESTLLSGELLMLLQEYRKNLSAVEYYDALPQAELITTQERRNLLHTVSSEHDGGQPDQIRLPR